MNAREMKSLLIRLGHIPQYPKRWPDVDILLVHYSGERRLEAYSDTVCRGHKVSDIRRQEITKLCLKALLDTDYPGKIRIMIAVCGVSDDMERFLRLYVTSTNVAAVLQVENSLGNAKNYLLNLSRAPILALVEDDSLCKPEWLKEGVARVRNKAIIGLSARTNKIAPYGGAWLGYRKDFIGVGGWKFDFARPVGAVIRSADAIFLDTNKEFAIRAMERGYSFVRVPEKFGYVMHTWEGARSRHYDIMLADCSKFLGKDVVKTYGITEEL